MAKKNKKLRHAPAYRKKTKRASGSQRALFKDKILQQALALHQAGRLPEAKFLYNKTLSTKPDNPHALYLLGLLLHQEGKSEAGVGFINRALALNPDFADAHNTLGHILSGQGKLDEAVSSFRRVITLKPDFFDARISLARILTEQDKLDEASACIRRALQLQPNSAQTHYNSGLILQKQGKLYDAITSYRRALALQPDFAEAHYNLGKAYKNTGRIDKAVASYRQALDVKPDYVEAHNNLLFCLNYLSGITQEEIHDESLQWGSRFANLFQTDTSAHADSCTTDRRLRVGYVSPDFRVHSVAYFIEPVISSHNREKVEVFCYANVKKPDEVTQYLQGKAEHWFSIVGKSDEEIAARIKKDGIDILVDLAGLTKNNSLAVFARKPAPVQVTWLGFPNTTGLRTIDYRLTDAIADPPGEADRLHTEKLVRLKHGFLCYHRAAPLPKVEPLPCLERGYITFGSFNNLPKVRLAVIRTWAKILNAVPGSHLLLKSKQLKDDQVRVRFRKMFAEQGIASERLEMHESLPRKIDHMALYNSVDIGLDTFPYNGTTTTCEALWMGVPVVTLLGGRHAGRVGASIMHRLGLDELVAPSVDRYIEAARSLAFDRKRLEEMRSGLRDRMQESVLMDSRLFTDQLEEVYQRMWREYCESVKTKK